MDKSNIHDRLKRTIITPIYKGVDRSIAANYRPVALTSHLIKVFMKVIVANLVEYLDSYNLWNSQQHGFRKGRSCQSQLLNHYNEILTAMEDGSEMATMFIMEFFATNYHG